MVQTMQAPISLSELESWLFEAANILRGPIDAADFKTYIFPLLFFKRICDVFDEEYQIALAEADGDIEEASYRENFRFYIPNNCHWQEVREHTENVGSAIAHAMRCIEKENSQTLSQIFGDVQWGNKERLPDRLLNNLIEHFSEKTLSNANVEPDMAGRAYEFLIKKFADESNKAAGEFYTPRNVIKLMMKILKPQEHESVYDPAVGTAGMLLEALNYAQSHSGNIHLLHLYGQEKNLTTSSIARMNLILHGREDFEIVRGDTLRNPAFVENDRLKTFDCVVANPPFSLKKWGEEVWEHDPYGRNFAGMPPSSYGDYAWVQHMISSMAKPGGRMAIVLPQGALFRKGAEGKIRKTLLEMDFIEAVIGLGPNLFYGTTLAACIVIFRQQKDARLKERVIFIDASEQFKKGRNQNELLDAHVDQIYAWYEDGKDVEGAVKVATLDEIREEGHNLNISLYVEPVIEEDPMTVEEGLSRVKAAAAACAEAEERLKRLLADEGVV